jgi:hypothetical protein
MKTDIPLTLRIDEDELNTLRDALVELAIADGVKLEHAENNDERAWLRASMSRCRNLLAKMPISVGAWQWNT